MKRRASPEAPLFRLLDIDAGHVERHPSALLDIQEGRVDGMIVRGALPPDLLVAAMDRLERDDPPLPRAVFSSSSEERAWPYILGGRTIVACAPDLSDYFPAAAAFRGALPVLLPGFEARMEALFGALSGGLPARVPEGPGGATYTPATIRVLPDGFDIGLHVGNAFQRLPQAQGLLAALNAADQLSYFIPLALPESGGDLVVYALEWSDVEAMVPAAGEASAERVYDTERDAQRFAELCDKEVWSPGPGDLIVFNGGRFYHRISTVHGPHPRRTIGGFLAFSLDGASINYWS